MKIKKCTLCDYQSYFDNFCPNDGSKMIEIQISKTCHRCGNQLKKEDNFCGKCGLPYKEALSRR